MWLEEKLTMPEQIYRYIKKLEMMTTTTVKRTIREIPWNQKNGIEQTKA
jgi:hypothetical protein